ncbi:D-2-hydroxyacid dehydrogenase [Halapricum salinum]|uniref:D-2-hydroxyacid dehydrogenase n=1 Tax=Halapricum salinum TaxID=1457250 RepID=A0A4D6HED1_9EURY|nr:D-2-hydroxyacid dehydrogenase [Halapricum salinum]QCC52444.1 D-2-hydroxyacid dehydrogenase [Halapricum salinum]
MVPEPTEILVFQQKLHGLPVERLVDALDERVGSATVSLAITDEAIDEKLPDATVVVGRTITTEQLELAESLELFACSFAGTDHLPLDELTDRGITVTNAGGVHASNAAEQAIGGLLALTRDLFRARRQQADGVWQNFQSGELAGGTATVVGLGAIGSAIAERLQPFDVTIRGVRHSPEKGGPVDEVYSYDEFEQAIVDVDAVLLACPLTETTRNLLDRSAFQVLHPETILVNVARGGVVDTEALLYALRWNDIGGAVLDVTDPEPLPPEHPLWGFENVLITPHNAGYTPEYYERLADILAENVDRARENGEWIGLRNQIVP